jgi:hypothetical protein
MIRILYFAFAASSYQTAKSPKMLYPGYVIGAAQLGTSFDRDILNWCLKSEDELCPYE